MSPHDGSHPATERQAEPLEHHDGVGPRTETDPQPELDGLIQDLGLSETTVSAESRRNRFDAAAVQPETAMTEFSSGEPSPPLSQSLDSPVLEQLDQLSTELSALDGETELGSALPGTLATMSAELAAVRSQLEADRRALDEAREALERREAELNERAAAGTPGDAPSHSSHAAALQILEAEIVRRTAELNQQRRALEQERAALDEAQSNWRIEYKTQKDSLEADLQKFSTRQRMIRQEQAEWDKKSAEFNAERTRLREQKQILQQQAAELADERERVEMQAATILVGARVAEITVNERNEFASERELIQAERAKFAQLQRDLDEQREAVAVQQKDLDRQHQQIVEEQKVARETHTVELQSLENRLREAEAALIDARRSADDAQQQLQQRTEELAREREAMTEERSRWEAGQISERPTASTENFGSAVDAAPADGTPDVIDEQGLSGLEEGDSLPPAPDAAVDVDQEIAWGDLAESGDDQLRRESTPEERAAAVFRLLGIRPEDQQPEPEPASLTASEDSSPADESASPSVLEAAVDDELDLEDDSAVRFAKLRAQAMGSADLLPSASVPTEVAEAEPVASDETPLSSIDEQQPILPRVIVDKDEVRENLRSLREVSQVSTMSALALHQSKHLRSSIVMRSLTAFICFAGAVAFLSGDLAGYEMFWMQGTVFLVVGIYMAFDAFQKTVQLGVITARRRACRRPQAPESPSQENGSQPA